MDWRTQTKKAVELLTETAALLKKHGYPAQLAPDAVGQRIIIPNENSKGWKYSIICGPGSYGYPESMEIGYPLPNGRIEVEGWLSPEGVLKFIEGREK